MTGVRALASVVVVVAVVLPEVVQAQAVGRARPDALRPVVRRADQPDRASDAQAAAATGAWVGIVPIAPETIGAPAYPPGVTIVGDTVIVEPSSLPRPIWFEWQLGGWAADGVLCLWQLTVPNASLSNGIGAALTAPEAVVCSQAQECESLWGRGSQCVPLCTGCDTVCQHNFQDALRQDFAVNGISAASQGFLPGNLIRLGSTAWPPGYCEEDDGSTYYGGNLVLEVPTGASGVYTIDFDREGGTFLVDDGGPENYFPITEYRLARVAIDEATACCLANECSLVLPGECLASGGSIGVTCIGDCDGDGIDNGCQSQADCDGDGTLDLCAIGSGASEDCDGNSIPDECEVAQRDCDGNGVIDLCETADGSAPDCNNNSLPDVCDLVDGDCDGNGIVDECELPLHDCNANGILDACEDPQFDCNGNSIPDECELAHADCNANGVLDECDVAGGAGDCDGNLVPDECQLAVGDCDGNGVLDSCEGITASDCDQDGICDALELAGAGTDCNDNGVLDDCDIIDGTSLDDDSNCIPDECDQSPAPLGEAVSVHKSRFLSFTPVKASCRTAIRVRFVSLTPPGVGSRFIASEGDWRWVGPPGAYWEDGNHETTMYASGLQCEPYYRAWELDGQLNVYGAGIMPESTYEVQHFDGNCGDVNDPACYSQSLMVSTGVWGDCVAPFADDPNPSVQPDFTDVSALVDRFLANGGPPRVSGEIDPNVLNLAVDTDFNDISSCVSSFLGEPYPYQGPGVCP